MTRRNHTQARELRDAIVACIADELAAGRKQPTQAELARRFGMTESGMCRHLKVLAAEGRYQSPPRNHAPRAHTEQLKVKALEPLALQAQALVRAAYPHKYSASREA